MYLQRLKALESFRDGVADYLMATDLASRGLDIKGIETVINYDMPGQLAQYLHRVGRTARAGGKGRSVLCCRILIIFADLPRRSVTLVGESDRKMLKTAIKHSSGQDNVRHRVVPPEAVSEWSEKLNQMTNDISEILQEEKEEKHVRCGSF
jgi:ATP-dependent RNA helicase DDX27